MGADQQAAFAGLEAGDRRRRQRSWRPELPLWLALLLSLPMLAAFAFLVFYPAIEMVATSLPGGNVDKYRLFLHDGPELRALKTTFLSSAIVTVATLTLGSVVAWTLRSARSRFMKVLFWLAVMVPFSMGVVVMNLAWFTILGRFGLMNWVLGHLGLPTRSLLFTTTAVTLGMVYTLFPFAVFPLYVTFRSIPDDLLDAAETLGGHWWDRMRTVVFPLALPGFFITAVLLFVLSIGFFVTPAVLGGPSSTFLAVLIQGDLQLRFDRPGAAATSVVLMVVALVLMTVMIKLVGKERFKRAIG
jgi:ABC-type spermidine/putrescine transport system permease subunit I